MSAQLLPYVARPVIDWLRHDKDAVHRRLEGSLLFADISGFTNLTERLAEHGKLGAEEIGALLNATFGRLLTEPYDNGASLIKWGGDAALLFFDAADGEDHAARAAGSAWAMQRTMARIGRPRTIAGQLTLRMSVGLHSGAIDLFLLGGPYRCLVVAGPAATTTALMEAAAAAGEIVLSDATAAALAGDPAVGPRRAGLPGRVLTAAPTPGRPYPQLVRDSRDVPDLRSVLPPPVAEHVAEGRSDTEHRQVATAFVEIGDGDRLLAHRGAAALAAQLDAVVRAAQDAAERFAVTLLDVDIGTAGPKLLLAAGAPGSRGEDADRLLAAAHAVVSSARALVPDLRVRAGAARGRVLVGDFGPPYRRVYSLVGDSVNLAARLMARAGPGQLVASAELIAATRVPFPARSLPPLQVKGKRDPVRAVVVTGPPDLAPRLAADDEWPLLGRDGDLAALLLAWQDARSGTGRVVEVVSEPGLGKSRLLAEFAAQAAGDVHLVSCEGYDATTPYAPVRRLVRSLLDITGGDGPVAAGAKLRAAVARRCPQLLPWLPLLATACGAAADVTAEVEALERRFRPARLADTVAELVACLVTRPAVIAVENSQHIDEASAEVFARLGRETPSRPWLFIVTRRPADRGNLLSAVPGLTSLWLTPLEDDDAHELLQRASEREPLAPYEARRLVQQAGGNPLFLRELLQVRREVGDADGLPDSVEAVVAVQIDRLPPAARRLLRAAAVLGTACDWGTLDAVLQADELTPGPGDWVLLDTFVSRTPEGLRFRQPLVRDAAYEGLPYRRRQRLHGFAAEAIELHNRGDGPSAGLLSLHFFRAQRYRAALRYSVMAAERAQAAYANADAAAFFDRAIDCGRRLRDVPPGETAQLAGRLGDVWSALGEFRRAERAYRTARRLLREPVQVAEVKLRLARTCTSAARYEQALRWLGSAMGELSRADREDPGLAARLAGQYAFVRYQQGRPRETRRWAEETIRQALTGESRGALARGYQLLDWACLTMGDFSHGPQAVQALRIWEELDEPAWQGRILNHLGMRAYYLGDWPAALARYARARDIFTRVGDEWCAAIAAFNVAEILTDQGELESAAELTRHVLRVCRAAGTPRLIAAATAQLGSIAARQADGQHAMALLAEAREIFDGAGETASVADVDWRVAECLVFCGRPADALDRVARLSLGLRDAAVSALVPTLHRLRGYALTQLGDAPGALGAIQQALRVGRERGARQDVAFALVALTRWYEHAGESVPVSMAEERDRLLSELGVTWVPAIPLACAGGLRGQPAGEHAATPAVS